MWKELGVQKDYSDWIKIQIETLDLEENLDFLKLPQKGEQKNTGSGGHNRADYIISLDAAKHIAMASRTPKGKEVRRYFIEMEKYARYILEEKAIRGNTLSYVQNEHYYIEKKQDTTLEIISDFQEINGKVIEVLKDMLNSEIDSLLMLNKAYVDSIEEPTIKKMYSSITESIRFKRDYLWEVIKNKAEEANKHTRQMYYISESKLKELEKDFKTIKERLDAENAN